MSHIILEILMDDQPNIRHVVPMSRSDMPRWRRDHPIIITSHSLMRDHPDDHIMLTAKALHLLIRSHLALASRAVCPDLVRIKDESSHPYSGMTP